MFLHSFSSAATTKKQHPTNTTANAPFRISNDNISTRRLGNPQGETEITFNRGDLYLVTTNGMIMRQFSIGPIDDIPNNQICINMLRTTGVQIDAVPGTVTHVYIVGNTSGNPTAPAAIGTNISAVRERLLHLFSQYNTDDVNLWASVPLRQVPNVSQPQANGHFLYEAFDGSVIENGTPVGGMTLRPTVARVELNEFEGIGQIASFTIDAIFIDRYFRQAQANGVTSATQLISREFEPQDTRASFFAVPPVDDYATDGNNALHDILEITSNANRIVASPSGQVWAYNLFAVSGAGNHSQMPGSAHCH